MIAFLGVSACTVLHRNTPRLSVAIFVAGSSIPLAFAASGRDVALSGASMFAVQLHPVDRAIRKGMKEPAPSAITSSPPATELNVSLTTERKANTTYARTKIRSAKQLAAR